MATPPPHDRSVARYSDGQVDEMIARRAEIEQAKGMIMYVHDVNGHTAFDMLRTRARTTNVKMQLLAQRLLDDPSLVEDVEDL